MCIKNTEYPTCDPPGRRTHEPTKIGGHMKTTHPYGSIWITWLSPFGAWVLLTQELDLRPLKGHHRTSERPSRPGPGPKRPSRLGHRWSIWWRHRSLVSAPKRTESFDPTSRSGLGVQKRPVVPLGSGWRKNGSFGRILGFLVSFWVAGLCGFGW